MKPLLFSALITTFQTGEICIHAEWSVNASKKLIIYSVIPQDVITLYWAKGSHVSSEAAAIVNGYY